MKKTKIQKIVAYFSVLTFAFVSLNNVCYGVSDSTDSDAGTVTEQISYPYQKLFKITSYYSPLLGQERYVTGNYESDIRLNGRGTNGADGTPVYPGMIAAPNSYAFGTKMKIPGIGTTSVHDRGGAIVSAGQKNQEYDRLDVWMGYGDKGLSRALSWGARTVEVTVFGIDDGIKEDVYLEGFSEAEKFVMDMIIRPKIFTKDIWYETSGENVEKLQEFLTDLGYFNEPVSGFFGMSTRDAVLKFQMDYGVVTSVEDFGAGHFGPQTRLKIEAVYDKRKETKLKGKNFGIGSSGDDVGNLQEILSKLGYDVDVTGEYDEKTIDAVFKFQFDHKIIESEYDTGAGFFGPKTYQVLVKRFIASSDKNFAVGYKEITNAGNPLFGEDLQFGDSGDAVLKLQEELLALNFLKLKPNGYFGKVTEHAVFKFQQANGLVDGKDSTGAGIFGPLTRSRMNEILASRLYVGRLIAEKKQANSLVAVNTEPVETEEIKEPLFVFDIGTGTSSPLVKKLQETLKNLGYFDGTIITDYFGEKTREAVIAFQLEKGIISSVSDIGAGRVGPQTRDLLNGLL